MSDARSTPPNEHDQTADGGVASWFASEEAIVAELRRAVSSAGTPEIAGYEHLRELARGAQGVVYAATQRSTRRAVAIKVLLDTGLSAGSARRRFEREIDLVASLKHPGIVAVYDSGITADGRLYLVMELVDGLPLDDALKPSAAASGGGVDPRAAARVVGQVADAVHHAHQRGVIHRDLKPSNIRVDAHGNPRVLDFGLAKVTSLDQPQVTQVSISGQFMGSLPWASPEQATGEPDRVDVRTDVYALGVILYQLITGRLPTDQTGGLKTILDRIVHQEPAQVRSLRPAVAEDLATVVHKALSKEPERRYQSAGDLAADLRHYLAGEPIAARRDSTWYAVRKTVRRYRIAAAAAAAVLAATLAALVVSLRALDQARADRDRAEQQTAVAKTEAGKSDAVARFMREMLTAADPGNANRDVKVVDILKIAADNASRTFKDQPESELAIRTMLCSAYRNLESFKEATAQGEAGMSLVKVVGEESLAAARLYTAYGVALSDVDEIDRAVELTRRGAALAKQLSPGTADECDALTSLGSVLNDANKLDEAAALNRELVSMNERVHGRDSFEAISAVGNLGYTLSNMGKFDEAIPLLQESIARGKAAFGPDSVAALAPVSTLVHALAQINRREESLAIIKDAWERLSRMYGPESKSALMYANNYAVALYHLERYTEAIPIAEDTLAKLRKTMGPEHNMSLGAATVLGSLYGQSGQADKQLALEKENVDVAMRLLGPTHPTTIYIRNNYAFSLGKLERYDESLAMFRAMVPDVDKAFDARHYMPQAIRYNMGVMMLRSGRTEEAIDTLRGAAEALLDRVGPDSDWTTDAVGELQKALAKAGRGAEIEPWRARVPKAFASPNGEAAPEQR